MRLFKSVEEVDPMEIELANGSTVKAKYKLYINVRLAKNNAYLRKRILYTRTDAEFGILSSCR